MKIRKNIYLTLGILCIVLDILVCGFFVISLSRRYRHLNYSYIVIPIQVLLIPALIFLFSAYRVQKKINNQQRQALENSFSE